MLWAEVVKTRIRLSVRRCVEFLRSKFGTVFRSSLSTISKYAKSNVQETEERDDHLYLIVVLFQIRDRSKRLYSNFAPKCPSSAHTLRPLHELDFDS